MENLPRSNSVSPEKMRDHLAHIATEIAGSIEKDEPSEVRATTNGGEIATDVAIEPAQVPDNKLLPQRELGQALPKRR